MESLEREKILVRWLEEVRQDATEIFLVGDIFDYWFEYKKVVPRGFTRFLGKVAEITDRGGRVRLVFAEEAGMSADRVMEAIGMGKGKDGGLRFQPAGFEFKSGPDVLEETRVVLEGLVRVSSENAGQAGQPQG